MVDEGSTDMSNLRNLMWMKEQEPWVGYGWSVGVDSEGCGWGVAMSKECTVQE